MKVFLRAAALSVLVCACSEKKEEVKTAAPEKPAVAKKEFKMYEASEMASLMELMYADNMNLKQRIIDGDDPGNFPEHFAKIHSAVMTDESENDAFFKEQAEVFLENQKLVYSDPANAKEHFNKAVSSCVACHEQKCEGPIPRIKKLYIK
jgi:cytochrome c553